MLPANNNIIGQQWLNSKQDVVGPICQRQDLQLLAREFAARIYDAVEMVFREHVNLRANPNQVFEHAFRFRACPVGNLLGSHMCPCVQLEEAWKATDKVHRDFGWSPKASKAHWSPFAARNPRSFRWLPSDSNYRVPSEVLLIWNTFMHMTLAEAEKLSTERLQRVQQETKITSAVPQCQLVTYRLGDKDSGEPLGICARISWK